MTTTHVQDECARGQQQLSRMEYLQAERTLGAAEQLAWKLRDFEALSRLYMPLQEARRQIRQRCGEGIVCLSLVSAGPEDRIEGRQVARNYPHGQLLVAGWGTLEPALEVRRLQREQGLYLETFLAAAYPSEGGRAIAIVPLADARLPDPQVRPMKLLLSLLPEQSIVLSEAEIPASSVRGAPQSYGQVMDLWERLHRPFLAAADAESEPMRKMQGYRRAIEVDYACELAHQRLADTARKVARSQTSC